MHISNYRNIIFLLLVLLLAAGCATYYQKNLKFQNYVLNGQIKEAEEILNKDKKGGKGKDKLLFYFNKGWVSWMLGEHKQSIESFAEADRIIEDYRTNYGLEALALISNPGIKPYKPEDFEAVMLNYYMAMNYLLLGQYDEAIVECKRVNIKLNQLNDKYKDHKNRYQQDAFAQNLMGLIYDANKDYNNAFIAYRNAIDVYEKDYEKNFNVKVPEQLKWDLLRAAYRTGFHDEVDYYEKKFGLKYKQENNDGGDLIFFWQNGFGPVKSEWSINFTKLNGEAGWIIFANDEYGLSFPFYIGDKPDNEKNAFKNLSVLRVAFPKYLERKPFFKRAEINANNTKYSLEPAQNINEIAFKTLRDRMLREMANSLLRLATKKALEMAANQGEQKDLGTAISIVNAMTEKADTRNWQTLPYSISYTRIPLPAGENTVQLTTYSDGRAESDTLKFKIVKGKTTFFAFHSIESLPLADRAEK